MTHTGTRALWLAKLAVTVGLLAYVFTVIPLSAVATTIATADVRAVVAGWSLVLVMHFVSALQMKLLTDRQNPSLSARQIFAVNLTTQFYGLFLPGFVAGGAIRWYKLSRLGRSRADVLAAMIVGRLAETLTLAAMGLVFWLLDAEAWSNRIAGLSMLAVFGGVLLTYSAALNPTALAWSGALLARNRWLPTRIQTGARRLLDSTAQCRALSAAQHFRLLGQSLARNLLAVLSTYLMVVALGLDLSVIELGWIRSFTTLLMSLPISLSGLGVREISLLLLLRPYGISEASALSLSLLWFSSLLASAMLGGLLEARDLLRGRHDRADAPDARPREPGSARAPLP